MRDFKYTKAKKAKTLKQFTYRIQKYFEEIKKTGGVPTVTGLANSLGYSRSGLIKMRNKNSKINEVVEYAKQFIEEYLESLLFGPKGFMYSKNISFSLKNNFNWKETIDETANINTKVVVKLNYTDEEDNATTDTNANKTDEIENE